MDIGILILRVVLGLTVAAHGAQKLFGLFGGGGISSTAAMLESLGFRSGRLNAYVLGTAELIGGVLFGIGLFTPLAAMAIIGVMTAAILSVHIKNGFFNTDGGFEFPLLLTVNAIAVAFTGPGLYSVDELLDLDLSGTTIAIEATVLGVLVGLAVASLRHLPDKVRFRRGRAQTG